MTRSSLLMLLGDLGKLQHIGAVDNSACCKHRDQTREDFKHDADRGDVHSGFLFKRRAHPPAACLPAGYVGSGGQLAAHAVTGAAFFFSLAKAYGDGLFLCRLVDPTGACRARRAFLDLQIGVKS